MSNHTFLYSTRGPDKPLFDECPEDGHLLVAAMSIPVFWYMLFDERSLRPGPVPDDPTRSYLHMTALTTDALVRAERRWPEVCWVLGRAVEPLFRTWVTFVRTHAKAYVHCETAERARTFKAEQAFEEELRNCLDAFKHVPAPGGGAINLNRWWRLLLEQAAVEVVAGDLRPMGNVSYCGFASQFPVPWSQNLRDGCGALRAELRCAPAAGHEPDDIRDYLDRWGGVSEFRAAKCRCGAELFRLAYHESGAQRTCSSCGVEHLICDSEEFRAEPADWSCAACGCRFANLGVGFRVARDGRVRGLAIGQRCGRCGRMDRCTGWETAGGPELFERV